MEYLDSYANNLKVEMDLGLRYVKLLREQGIARRAPQELAPKMIPASDRERQSIWLWDTKRVLSSDAEIDAFVEQLATWNVKRVYAYLYSDGQLLADSALREKFTLMLHLCRQQDVEVWALLGEPEWLSTPNADTVRIAVNRITAFNSTFESFEPTIAGIKMDLEPHSVPGWNTDAAIRNQTTNNYLAALNQARTSAGGDLPVWADLSVKFFKPDDQALLDKTRPYIVGATVMTYFDSEAAILKWAQIAAENAGMPIEVGVELSAKAPASDRITEWTAERRHAFHQSLLETMSASPSFTGVALHDYTGLSSISNGGTR